MKTGLLLFLLFLVVSVSIAQDSANSSHGSESLLLALENAWNQAQLRHDSEALEGLVADSFSTDNDGTFTTKAGVPGRLSGPLVFRDPDGK